MPALVTLRRQTGDIIYESSNDGGDVLTVFEDYSLVAITAEGEEYFHGYLALNSAGSIIMVGTDVKGYQYVFDSDYMIGLTVNGNVFMGISEFLYFYDYDADGNIGEFYADGIYAIYDEDGNVLEEGDWLPDDDSSLSDEGNDDIINDEGGDDYGDEG
jgi:hypothetical protein